MPKLAAQLKTAKYIRRKSKRNVSVKAEADPSFSLCLMSSLAVSPLVMVDLSLSSLFWLHTMLYQLTMYGVYLGLFVFCHATGLTHKLERTQQEQALEAVELKGLEDRREDESGYLSDTDCDDR